MKKLSLVAYEHKRSPIISREDYLRRQTRHLLIAGGVVALALSLGVIGYHFIEGLRWIDSIYMASNILTGMGPTADLKSDAGKLFGSAYALFAGVVFLTAASVLLAPALHRMLHRLHMESEEASREPDRGPDEDRRK